MNSSAPTDYGETPYPHQVEIDEICDRFEAELKRGRRPRVEEFVNRSDPLARAALAGELLKLELDYRRDEAEAIRKAYESHFPELLDVIRTTCAPGEPSLNPGTLWSDFRIQRHIGAGGMGVVYEAYDTKLERTVALKFVPDKFAQDHQRLARFEREAKILAGLNHPNIATLHNLEQHQGTRFLVLEFVPGETLAQMISQRRIPLDELLSIFTQIAQALESAHEAGVVHRDLKPSNVKITAEGHVKVLDFGLATSPSVSCISNDNQLADFVGPTESSRHGMGGPSQSVGLSGTLAYMSPEQARGKPIDKRCDIWAFGCCLYEALTREKAYLDATPQRVLLAIAEREPDWTLLPGDTPASLVRLLHRCLTKNPRQRLRDIGEARIELADYENDSSSSTNVATEQQRRPLLFRAVSIALLASVATGLVVFGLMRGRPEIGKGAEARLLIRLPPGVEVNGSPALALSPNGSWLAFVATAEDGDRRLFVKRRNEFQAKMLDGTKGAKQPFFSPDGQTIGFFAEGCLKTISVFGGQPVLVCDARHPIGACWTHDDRIILAWDVGGALDSIAPDGADRKNLARSDAFVYSWPELMPDGETLVFGFRQVMMANLGRLEEMADHRTGTALHSVVIRQGSFARFVKGHLLYGHRGTLYAVPFRLDPPQVTGTRRPIVDDLWTERGSAQFAVSKSGDVAYIPGKAMEEGQLVWKYRQRPDDPPEPAWKEYQVYESFQLSPDSKQLAIGVLGAEGYDVWICDFETKTASNLDPEGENQRPIWSPDGMSVVFLSDRNSERGLYLKELGTTRPLKLLVSSPFRQTPRCFSNDGKKLIFYRNSPNSSEDIWEFDFAKHTEKPLIATEENESFVDLSPDGEWMAYASTGATPGYQVFVCRYPPTMDAPTRISMDTGATDPMWSPVDENEIFYLSGGRDALICVTLARNPIRVVGRDSTVTGAVLDVPGFSFDYDPKLDRFLVIQAREDTAPKTEIRLILNWSDQIPSDTE